MTTDNRTNEPTEAQVEAAAREWYEQANGYETWASASGKHQQVVKVRAARALVAAAGAAPQAESEAGKRLSSEFRADLVEAARERIQAVWADVPEGVDAKTLAQNVVSAQEFFWLSLHFPVLPSSTVDEAALIREAKAEALEEASLAYGSGQLSGIFLGRDDYPKAWLRACAAEYREGSET